MVYILNFCCWCHQYHSPQSEGQIMGSKQCLCCIQFLYDTWAIPKFSRTGFKLTIQEIKYWKTYLIHDKTFSLCLTGYVYKNLACFCSFLNSSKAKKWRFHTQVCMCYQLVMLCWDYCIMMEQVELPCNRLLHYW